MAYALRYYKEIAQTDGGVVRLEIHKKDSTTSAVEIGAVVQGLSLEIQGQQDDIDTPIQKTSLHMTFVDAQDIENGKKNGFWEEFYTPNALLWKVILKAKSAKETSFRTIWGGYVTPDSFSEDLVYRGSVSITARDNIGHMQDFPFDAMGDADGMISLYNLVSMGWEKIQSPMSLSWAGIWLESDGVIAYETLMNVSQFQGKDWYKAIETALASYGAVMRYVGNNAVIITTLRSLPSQGGDVDALPHIEPKFVTGAQRELVPAVKRIEETVDYVLEDSWSIPQIQPSDFTGNIYTYRCKVEGENWGTLEHEAPVWAIPINIDRGWDNLPSESLFFNIDAYEVGYFSDYRGLGEEMKRYMYIAANNVDDRSVWYSKQITCADMSLRIKFGLPVCLNRNNEVEQMSVFALKSIRYTISLKKDGAVSYYAGGGTWQASEKILEKTYDITANETEFVEQIGMDDNVGICDLVFEIKKIEYAKIGYGSIANIGLYACIQDIAFTTASTSSLRETNTVNTSYNSDNNVILSRDPELGPAFDKVAIPAFIKNGIFYRNVDGEILPARLWSWDGREQQIAVWNHLQLLCYYAKPNNLISGTIVNADLTRVANIWMWHGAEHILISGTYNFLNGMIESAVLREFTRYDGMWSDVPGAAMPDTEQDSRSNVESGSGTSSNAPTYTSTTNVNIGGGGGSATHLSELLDVDLSGLTAKSVLYYDGEKWVDRNMQDLVGWYIDTDTGALTTDKDVVINGNLIVKKNSASGGTNDPSTNIGTVDHIVINGKGYYPDNARIVDLSEAFEGLQVDIDLSGYLKTTDIAAWAKASTKPTYTKAEVGLENVDNTADSAKSVLYAATAGSAPASDVYAWAKKSSLALSDVPDLSDKYLPLSGGLMQGTILPNLHNHLEIGEWETSFYAINSNYYRAGSNINNLWLVSGAGTPDRGIVFARTSDGSTYTQVGKWTSVGLGIGTISPEYKLDIEGYVRATKFILNKQESGIWAGSSYSTTYAADSVLINGTHIYLASITTLLSGLNVKSSAVFEQDVIIEGNLIVKGDSASGGTSASNTAYLPLSGGTMVSDAGIYNPNGSASYAAVAFNTNANAFGDPYFPTILRSSLDVTLNKAGTTYTLVHTGNISSYALPKSGGALTGDLTIDGNIFIRGISTNPYIRFSYGGQNWYCQAYTTNSKIGIFLGVTSSLSLKVDASGNVTYAGTISGASDIRYKNKKYDYTLDLHSIANAPLFAFTWNDRNDPDPHLGTSAQYWESIVPQLVSGTDFKALDYSTLGVAMGISLAKKTLNHEERIKALESENKALKEQLSELYNGTVC